jgi:predicted O-methyltransferase YrrM
LISEFGFRNDKDLRNPQSEIYNTSMKFFTAIKYLKYIFLSSSKRGHGIHSPFVFNIVLKVFRNKTSSDIVCKIETIRKRLISDPGSIDIIDFGTGSILKKGKLRRVSEIARYSSVPEKYGKLLAGLSSEFGKTSIIEFGTSFGISTMYMAAGNPAAIVYTLEGSDTISDIAKENFLEAGLANINILTGSFEKTLPEIEKKGIIPGLVFIDGNHRKEPTLEYFNRMVKLSDENSVIVLDDIYYSAEMGEAWNEIKNNDKVSFTIDIFKMGLVFFRQGMTRNDYIIRY